jgi:gliding motility-associated-like protein
VVPNLDAGNDTAVCFGVKVLLHATGANSYKWLPPTNNQLSCINCANPLATLTSASNTFIVQDTSVLGCVVKDSVTVKYLVPYTVSVTPMADSLCLGQSVQFFASGAQLYQWLPATDLNNPNIGNPIATPSSSTTYSLTATDTLGCQTFTQAIPITVFPYPTVNAGADVTIVGGTSTQLQPVVSADATNYTWTPPFQLSCNHCLAPITTPKATTTYKLTVSNVIGCATSDDVTITILCNGNNVFIPNTFSPNGDGINDMFYLRGTGLFSIKSLRIFNRWGNMVFNRTNMTPNDPSQGWDGKSHGTQVMADVYTYMAEVYCENNTLITINGNVTVVY